MKRAPKKDDFEFGFKNDEKAVDVDYKSDDVKEIINKAPLAENKRPDELVSSWKRRAFLVPPGVNTAIYAYLMKRKSMGDTRSSFNSITLKLWKEFLKKEGYLKD